MEEEKKKAKEEMKKVELKIVTPIPIVTPIIGVIVKEKLVPLDDDDDDHKGLMSSLRNLFENRKYVKSLEKKLTKILDRIQKIVTTMVANLDLQVNARKLVNIFDEHFTTLVEVASTQAHAKHYSSLFDRVCTSVT